MNFKLYRFPLKITALEPFISRKTLEFHYRKHHQTYETNLINLITGTKFENIDLETIIKVADGPVFNNASQVWNHTFYFACLKPPNNITLSGTFTDVIDESFGSVSFFKEVFIKSAVSLFGSGWTWLVRNTKGSLEIIQESN